MIRLTVFVAVITLLGACQPEEQPPNILFILVDDLGWNDVGYNGSAFYETPHIDGLADESFRFPNAYSSGSVCSPSRAAIMTGLHPARLNITDWIPGADPRNRQLLGPDDLDQLPLEHETIAEALSAAGYATMFAGKWHLGDEGYFPEDQGFDINVGGHHRGSPPGGYYVPYENPKMTDGPEGEYLTDRLTSEVIHFIDTLGGGPFFAFLSFYTVHTPIQPNLEYVEQYRTRRASLELPEELHKEEGAGTTTVAQHNAEYASMVHAMDVNVGRLVTYLKDRDLYDNTVIVFTSDNGGLSTLDSTRRYKAPTSVRPLRAGKGWLYEGGIRVPLLIKDASNSEGRTVDTPVVGHDLAPTILKMASISVADNQEYDGKDLTPLMIGSQDWSRQSIWWHYPHYHGSAWTPGAAIRQGDLKLIEFYETGKVELFDLGTDVSEQNDISGRNPEITERLLSKLREEQETSGANEAIANASYSPVRGN